MNNTAIGVAAALLLGGGALYGGYQLLGDDADTADLDGAREDVATRDQTRTGSELAADRDAMDFGKGADGADVTDNARRAAQEAEREAERLAMLGTEELDIQRPPGDDGAAADDETGRERGLRGATPADAARADDDLFDRPRSDSDVDRLLADIAAKSGDAAPDGLGDTSGAGPVRVGANGATTVAGKRLVDKPDKGGFTARLIDKPDEGGFVASADTQRFDPCEKADGTLYVGPGTALNPFAATDPCLPQATAQGLQVAQLGEPGDPDPTPPVVDVAQASRLVPVDVARPQLAPPPPIGIGSDYQ